MVECKVLLNCLAYMLCPDSVQRFSGCASREGVLSKKRCAREEEQGSTYIVSRQHTAWLCRITWT